MGSGGTGGGATYGSDTQPDDLGSGGSAGWGGGGSTLGAGGNGGGRVRLIVAGELTVAGGIHANGGSGADAQRDGGGGSGGSIWIQAQTFSGGGALSAVGGSGRQTGGGGGGGRIAVDVQNDSFVGTISVSGGSGLAAGQIGTVVPGSLFGVSQSAAPAPASYGGVLTYTLRVSNNGTGAIDAVITNTLPADVVPTGILTWTAGIAAGATWTQEVAVSVNPDAADPLSNLLQATVAGQTRSVTLQTPLEDVPISGLTVTGTTPVLDGSPANFAAAVSAGSNVSYSWNFGDGALGAGRIADHVYPAPGVYTATVTAGNSRGSAQAGTVVTVEPLPNFRGVAFHDLDGDGLQGAGEPGLAGVLVTAAGPAGTLNDTTASNGSWRIDSGDAGTYVLNAALAGYTLTSDAPLPVPLPDLGSTYVNFGLAQEPAPGSGAIQGRVFADANGNGLADTGESGFAGVAVALLNGAGTVVNTAVSAGNGTFSFPAVAPGIYAVRAPAPAGYFPLLLESGDLSLAAGQVQAALLGFGGGGELVGTVRNGGGYPVSGITLVLEQNGAAVQTAVTTGGGQYSFPVVAPGAYELRIAPPPEYQLPDGVNTRPVEILSDSQTVADWTITRQGRLRIRSFLAGPIPYVPIGGARFVITGTLGHSTLARTDGFGEAIVDDLPPDQYLVFPVIGPDADFTVNPAQRIVDVSNDSSAVIDFFYNFPRSIRVRCERRVNAGVPYGPPFPCIVTATVISATNGVPPGTVVGEEQLNGERTTIFTEVVTGTYRITITPDPAVDGQAAWPVYEEIVALGGGDHREVAYPFNPTPGTTRLWGYAFYDRNQDGQRQDFAGTQFANQDEAHDSAANGMTVVLKDLDGTVITTAVTQNHGQYGAGYYEFLALPNGSYVVEITLRSGLFATTPNSLQRTIDSTIPPAAAHFGYRKQFGSSIGGLVFYDNNGNGAPDPDIDDPVVGAELILRDVGGVDLETVTSSGTGSYAIYPIPSGEYTLVLVPPAGGAGATTLERPVAVPDGDSAVTLNYALAPTDGRTRAIVYVDQNFNQAPDAGEFLSGVALRRQPASCQDLSPSGGNSVTAVSNADGLALFPPVALAGCVSVDDPDSLPPGVGFAGGGRLDAPGGSGFVWLRLLPAGTVTVRPFWDQDGDGARDGGEPLVAGALVAVDGSTQPAGVSGATFSLEAGSYGVMVTPPGGMSVAVPLPLTVAATSGGSAAHDVPLRFTGQVAGTLLSSGGSPTWANLQVILEDLDNGTLRYDTVSVADSYFQFSNLPPATYRLKLAAVPSGWALAAQPTFTYGAGQTVNQNLTLLRLGSVSGLVYLDTNGSGSRNGGEPATGQYDVTLTNNAGLADVTVDVASDGSFAIPNLVPGVQYAVTVDLNSNGFSAPGSAITQSPGWFTVNSSGASVTIGVYPYSYSEDISGDKFNTVFGRVYEQVGTVKNPHAGAVISYWPWNDGSGCSVVNTVLGTAVSDADGYYRLLTDFVPDTQKHYCIKVTSLPGFTHIQPAVTQTSFYYQSTGGMIYYPGVYPRDLVVTPLGPQRQGAGVNVTWNAFRDDNGNGLRDGDEPALPEVILRSGTISATSDLNGDGLLAGLAAGRHDLSVTPPAGYLPVAAPTATVWISGTDVALGGLPFRLVGWLSGSVFGDADGDGWRAPGELGLGGITVTLSGPVVTSTATSVDGSFALAGLPDGTYVVSVATPAGFAPLPPRSVSLAGGGAVQLGLQPAGLLGGTIYDDWDGDGRRLPDEPPVAVPLTVTLSGGAQRNLAAGQFLFLGLSDGVYTVMPQWSAALSATVDSGAGGSVALPAVPAGVLRGTVWHDANRDGLRQPDEAPLSGVPVSVAGLATVTDGTGRFQFFNVLSGTHVVAVDLPAGTVATLAPVTVDGLRGAAVGVAAAEQVAFRLFLPAVQAAADLRASTAVPPAAPPAAPMGLPTRALPPGAGPPALIGAAPVALRQDGSGRRRRRRIIRRLAVREQ